jgi:hypothetical protein
MLEMPIFIKHKTLLRAFQLLLQNFAEEKKMLSLNQATKIASCIRLFVIVEAATNCEQQLNSSTSMRHVQIHSQL